MSDKPFSERMGFTKPKSVQINDLDGDARMALYNAYQRLSSTIPLKGQYQYWQAVISQFLKMSEKHNIVRSFDGRAEASQDATNRIYEILFRSHWYESFDLIEFIYPVWLDCFSLELEKIRMPVVRTAFAKIVNDALKQENVGWRFSKGKIVPIQSQEEQDTIERALDAPFAGARNHIQQSLVLFSDRSKPDYANSIKESISAVESICKEITGKEKFSDAVNKLGIPMHPAFQKAAKQLYGFTSDEAGVRHAATGEPPLQVNQATARYMLIVCSAMVNFITDQKSDAK